MRYIITILFATLTSTIFVNFESKESICSAITGTINEVLAYYDGWRPGGVLGMFKEPYYWWEAGEVWGGMISAAHYCNNNTWESLIYESLMHHRGDQLNYIPKNQSMTEGNDDQGFWGIAVMEAVEKNFKNPPSEEIGWLGLVQTVVATMNDRWDTEYCDGGLRWQIFTWNKGYTYKNTVSNGCLFHLSARLARYTSNGTYIEIANKTWNWLEKIGLVQIVDDNDNFTLRVFDGTSVKNNCTKIAISEWSYNYGLLISGCAYLYSTTNDTTWLERVRNIWETCKNLFFKNHIMFEQGCESKNNCDNDQMTFKAIFSRFLHQTALLIPELQPEIFDYLKTSAYGAASSCIEESNIICGVKWSENCYDNTRGLGQQISAMEIFTSFLALQNSSIPLTNITGGTSQGVEGGRHVPDAEQWDLNDLEVSKTDKIGAGFLTVIIVILFVWSGVWVLW